MSENDNNKEPGMAFSMPKLHKIMAICSVVFFISVVWVFLDDYIRPWKAIQVEAIKIQRRHVEEAINAAQKEIDAPKLAQLEADLKKGQEIVATRKEEIAKVEKEVKSVRNELKELTIVMGVLNAKVTEMNFKYESAESHGYKKKADANKEKLHELKAQFAESKNKNKDFQAQEKVLLTKLADLNAEVITTEKGIKDITNKLNLLQQAKEQTKFGPIFAIRNLPFLDFLDPTIKIRQIVVNNVTDDRYFKHVPKVDRCITCHTFIDQPGFEKEVNPFKTHPKLDLMVGAESKHPMKQIGCTSCHGGEGHRVNDFNSAAHMPQNEKQQAEWVAKYKWHEPHKVPEQMLRLNQTEASCVKCHQGVDLIKGATVLNEGRQKIEKYGCYACHKIAGWEHKRKPGPSLLKIAGKVDKEWFKAWVWAPKSINPNTKMPSFFMQSNNSKKEFAEKNIAEVNAMAEYIYNKSKTYEPFQKYTGGNADTGKQLISEIGCLACHGVDGLEDLSKKVGGYAGPHLSGIGSKVSADWLVSWLKKPWHYQEDTIMPSFRLTDQEANDITAYLMGLKNKKVEGLKFAPLDKKVRDGILADYLSAFDTIESAREKVSKMTDDEKTMELGRRSIAKYGCFSCHNIEGFDSNAPIGPELTKVGSKPITQFGFGLEHAMPKQRDVWITAHLQNPKRWDIGIQKEFKDLLLMPNFYMSKKDAEDITVALLGQVANYIPLAGVKRYNAGEAGYNEAMKVAGNLNCVGCHQVDGLRGDLLRMYEDDINQGPPRLVNQGHRVQTDWFYNFLGNVEPIRPWVKVRMPSFNLSLAQKNAIVGGFAAGAHQGIFEEEDSEVVWGPGEREEAIKLFNAYNCVSCHTGGFNNGEQLAPNLHKAGKRLRPSWIRLWLKDPQKIMPGTSMPTFFTEEGKGLEEGYFGGDADKQIDALTKYIIELGKK